MGNRRMGRKRLYSLNKLGQTSGMTAGPGIADAIVSSTVLREGHRIITEITVDLGTSKAQMAAVNNAGDVIGHKTNGGAAYICQLTPAVNGYIAYAEMSCVELPTANARNIDLAVVTDSNRAYNYDIDSGGSVALWIAPGADWALGGVDHYAVTHGTMLDLGDNWYVYLANRGGSHAVDYDAGKFVIRFEGYAACADK